MKTAANRESQEREWSHTGCTILAAIVLLSVFVSMYGAPNAPHAVGGAIGLLLIPWIVYALCQLFMKLAFKRRLGPVGSLVSFVGTWIFFAVAHLWQVAANG